MSRSKRIGKAGAALTAALDRVRQAAARVKPFTSGARAGGGYVHRARAWAAPHVERAGKALENSVAPKVSAMLSSAAQRIEPAKPRRRRWRKLAGISLTTAASGAVAAVVRNRAKPDQNPPGEADTDSAAPAAKMRDENARTSADAGVDRQVRTP
jgi:hypothetical protein